jgi:hypothetical protein
MKLGGLGSRVSLIESFMVVQVLNEEDRVGTVVSKAVQCDDH